MNGWAMAGLFVRFNFTANLAFLSAGMFAAALHPSVSACGRHTLLMGAGLSAMWAGQSLFTGVRALWAP